MVGNRQNKAIPYRNDLRARNIFVIMKHETSQRGEDARGRIYQPPRRLDECLLRAFPGLTEGVAVLYRVSDGVLTPVVSPILLRTRSPLVHISPSKQIKKRHLV